jgi:hypothetical protein
MTFCLLMPGIPESKPRGKASSVTFQFYTAMKTCIIRWYPHIFRGFNAISAITCRVLTGSCSLGPGCTGIDRMQSIFLDCCYPGSQQESVIEC